MPVAASLTDYLWGISTVMKCLFFVRRSLALLSLLTLTISLANVAQASSDDATRGISPPEAVTISNAGLAGSSMIVSSIALDDSTHFSLIAGGSCVAPPFELLGGESCTQLVVFDPQALGPLSANLLIISDAASVTNDTVALTGNGTPGPQPELSITPDPMDFGLVSAADLPITDVFTVSNTGDPGTSVVLNNAALSGAGQFSIVGDTCTGTTLNDGDACSVSIEFDSTNDGMFTGELEIQSSIGDETVAIQGSTQIPVQLAFVAQPADSVVNQVIAPAIVVEVQDSSGTRVALDNSTVIELVLANDPSGSASLGGTLSATVSAGQASFTDLTVDQVGFGFALSASDSALALSSDISTGFAVFSGPPAGLEFIAQPSDTGVGQTIAPPVIVRVVDAFGFTVTSDNSSELSLALVGGTPGALLSGGGPVTVSAGLASFAGLSVDQVGLAYQLAPSGVPGALSGPNSASFAITSVGSGTSISSVNPAGSQTVGQPYTVTVQVSGFNPTGTVTVTDGSDASCDIVLPAISCDLTSTSVGPKTLTANYPGDANNNPSSATASYSITQAAASLSIDAVDPVAQQAVNTPVTVTVSVTGFNPSGTVTIDDGDGSSCLIVLPADSCDLTSTTVGPKTITASYPGDSNNTADSDSTAYTIVAGAPASLSFSTQPVNGTAGVAFSVEVQVLDAFGNLVLADNASSIALNLIGGNASATLNGGAGQPVTNGVANFSALSVDLVGADYQLQAEAVGLSAATSDGFEIAAGPAAALRFDVQPSTTQVNSAISPDVVVSVRDGFGNLLFDDSTTTVGLSLQAPPGVALQNNAPVSVSNGLATFSGLAIDTSGVGYKLRAQDALSALPELDSALFNITESTSVTTIDSITPAASQTVGQAYMVQATVTGQAPSGVVVVSDDNGGSCQFAIPGQNSCALSSSVAGPTTLMASYAGDVNNASSSDSQAYLIDQAISTISSISVAPINEQTVGQPYTVTVALNGFNPTGVIEISDGAGAVCQIVPPQTGCSLSSNSVGPKTLSADYSGDGNNTSSSTTLAYSIVAVESTTSILGITPPGEQEVGLPYTVTVNVDGTSPSGTVTVQDGAGATCSFDLPEVGCELTSTTAGPRTISASYSGDADNSASSDAVAYTITSGTAAALAFALEPNLGIAGGPLLPGLVVSVVNSQGGLISDDNTTVIQVAIVTNPVSGGLSGTTTLQVVNGIADFSDLSIDQVGEGYQIEARVLSRGLSAIVTAPFDVKADQAFKDRFEALLDEVFKDRFERR